MSRRSSAGAARVSAGLWVTSLGWGRKAASACAVVCALAAPALAQPRKPAPSPTKADPPSKPTEAPATKPKGPIKEQNFNFNALDLDGRTRSPQLLYFLERANEELERASLERRSFIPHLVRTVEDEAL